jgi:hypothetical protein
MRTKIVLWLTQLFETTESGPSLRKALAVGSFGLIVYIHIRYCDQTNAIEFLITDVSTMLALVGLYTWQGVQKNKNANPAPPTEVVVQNVEKVENVGDVKLESK